MGGIYFISVLSVHNLRIETVTFSSLVLNNS